MSGDLSIEDVGAEGIDDVMAIMTEAFDPAYREAWTAGQCLSMLSLPGVWLSLARIDGAPAGFTLNRAIAGESELLLLAVTSACRGRGVGTRLIDRTVMLSRERGADKLHLEVRHNNPAFELYINCGFRIAGRRPGYYQSKDGLNHDAVTLSYSLKKPTLD
jgi:ribosomal-protein-alanine N-acetyltransferase